MEIKALIHSEWSEALEEYRAGRPMVWYSETGKPEGIAVELMDGCIRILDYVAHIGDNDTTLSLQDLIDTARVFCKQIRKDTLLPEVVSILHDYTALAGKMDASACLLTALGVAAYWVQMNGFDPEHIMREKHEYNKTRPYKHGKIM